jgi:Rieske 2Fe-2S family protein
MSTASHTGTPGTEATHLIREALQMLEDGRQFSGGIYSSPEIYELEKERVFKREWLAIDRVESFQNPGDYKAFRIVDEPILVCCDNSGQLNGFRNVCRHRGVEVAVGEGNLKKFTCPYHAWEYDLNGRLTRATYPEDIKGYDLGRCRLPPVRLETWGGFVFINLDNNAPSLLESHGEILAQCEFLNMQSTRLARTCVIEPACNWKLIGENVWDIYHLGVVHANSFARDFNPRDFQFHLMPKGAFYGNYRSQSLAAPDGKSLFGTMPWLDVDESFAFGAQIPPTFSILARHDAFYSLITEPTGPDKCRIVVYTLLPEAYFDQTGFDERADQYGDFIELIIQEDNDMLASIQVGINSEVFDPGPATHLESAVHHLTKDILERIA